MSNITESKFKRCLRCGRKIAVKGEYCKTCQDKNIAETYTEPLKPPYNDPEFQKLQQHIEDVNHHNEIYERFAINFYRTHGLPVPEPLLESIQNRLKTRQQT